MSAESLFISIVVGGTLGLIIFGVTALIMKKKGKAVPRYSKLVSFSGDFAKMRVRIDEYLASQGYLPYKYKNEIGVYKKGTGMATSKKFIKAFVQEEGYLVQGFVDIYGTESGLEGYTGIIPKRSCKKVVDQVIALIQQGDL